MTWMYFDYMSLAYEDFLDVVGWICIRSNYYSIRTWQVQRRCLIFTRGCDKHFSHKSFPPLTQCFIKRACWQCDYFIWKAKLVWTTFTTSQDEINSCISCEGFPYNLIVNHWEWWFTFVPWRTNLHYFHMHRLKHIHDYWPTACLLLLAPSDLTIFADMHETNLDIGNFMWNQNDSCFERNEWRHLEEMLAYSIHMITEVRF